jgi:SAM-dependent methyltransferase
MAGALTKNLETRLYKQVKQPGSQFMATVRAEVRPHFNVLNAGCGSSSSLRIRGTCARVVGYDIDDEVFANTDVDEAIQGDLAKLNLPDNTFDLVISAWVAEHLESPAQVFREFARVMKPGGRLILITPNKWHYSMIVSRFTPVRFHRWFVNLLGQRPHDHAFPTFYRANTAGSLRRLGADSGLVVTEMRMLEGKPSYLSFSAPVFLIGAGYERLVNSWRGFAPIRHAIQVAYQKPAV